MAAAQSPFELVKVADGVYGAIRTVPLARQVDGNSVVLINDEDVVVVDADITPSSARAVLAEIRKLTNKPVRFVVNTHWHDDHTFGNMVYQDAFPQVEFIAHANSRADFLTRGADNLKQKKEIYPQILAGSEKQLASGKDRDGKPLSEADRKELTELVALFKDLVPELQATRLVPATITLTHEMTLYRGKRVIQILHLGRGNTRGDLVIYLPQEKVLITGDLLVNPIPFAFGSYLGEWVQDLKKLRALEADVTIPGHGPIEKDRTYLDLVIKLLETTLQQTQDAVKKGLSLDETRKLVILESFRKQMAGDDPVRDKAFTDYYLTPAIERAYKEAKGELEKDEP
jgi:glyoxylase-like metal-dependent hydrolase (beta-lactamase superfamily II)